MILDERKRNRQTRVKANNKAQSDGFMQIPKEAQDKTYQQSITKLRNIQAKLESDDKVEYAKDSALNDIIAWLDS